MPFPRRERTDHDGSERDPTADDVLGRATTHGDRVLDLEGLARGAIVRLVGTGRYVGFWLAVLLPFIALPLLASGVSTRGERRALLALVALNLLGVYVGRDHRPR